MCDCSKKWFRFWWLIGSRDVMVTVTACLGEMVGRSVGWLVKTLTYLL